MSVEASGGGACVGSSDRSGGNNVGDECRIEIDQRFSEQEKKQFDQNEESSDQRFSEEEKKQFVSFEKASKAAGPETQLKNLGIKTDYAEFLVQDLFLLENQLPYQLLQLIIQCASKKDELLKSIYKFIFYRFRTPEEWSKNKDEILKDVKHNHVHLLDLLRKKLIQPFNPIDEKRDLMEIIIDWTVYLFDKLKCNKDEFDRDWIPFRNIEKLREAGINLKRSKMVMRRINWH
ncbi:hypothetical protein QYF36_007463 [Acer negundo]|nr:hypothetical protein QYF36_005546 [Acer negundo]KAK4837665.1 hypothetical protein QYF36_007463 [Acer negundo]